MCRLAAYSGSEISLSDFLLSPSHSLYKQSWQAQEMHEATVNADGFGFAWRSVNAELLAYRSTLPIWSDSNLAALGSVLKSTLWLGNVRSATLSQGPTELNTQPFIADNVIYLHNGYIKPFTSETRAKLLALLSPDLVAQIHGNTDSEYLFALIRQAYQQDNDLLGAICNAVAKLSEFNLCAILGLIIYAGENLYLCRHALQTDCPSLYYSINGEGFPNATVVASERLDTGAGWRAVPEHAVLKLEKDKSSDELVITEHL